MHIAFLRDRITKGHPAARSAPPTRRAADRRQAQQRQPAAGPAAQTAGEIGPARAPTTVLPRTAPRSSSWSPRQPGAPVRRGADAPTATAQNPITRRQDSLILDEKVSSPTTASTNAGSDRKPPSRESAPSTSRTPGLQGPAFGRASAARAAPTPRRAPPRSRTARQRNRPEPFLQSRLAASHTIPANPAATKVTLNCAASPAAKPAQTTAPGLRDKSNLIAARLQHTARNLHLEQPLPHGAH